MAGARHVIPASGGFDAAEVFDPAHSVGRLSMFAAPTIVKRLVDHAQASGANCSGIKTKTVLREQLNTEGLTREESSPLSPHRPSAADRS